MSDPQSTFLNTLQHDPWIGTSAVKLALALKQMRAANANTDLTQSEPIAVIGMGCRFPGGADSPDAYWQRLLDKMDAVGDIPADRWDAEAYYDPDPLAPGKMNTKRGSFIRDADRFDPAFFGIAPREAAAMDPQQRLFLEVTWEALWNAGMIPERIAGSLTGVFTSIYIADYAHLLLEEPTAIGPHSCAGASHAIASGRVSYLLDLHGPCVSVNTACSSSLVAIHLAVQSLRAGECRTAIGGGVSLHLTPEHVISLAKLGMLSPDGYCRTFDARANGFVPGEGCGVVILKRLSDAIADGDHVHAVIRGSAVLQDGRSTVLTAPNGLAQQLVVRAALANAHVAPEQVTYVETHGTGTALGDPIEVEALADVLHDPATPADARVECALGSVKTNMGHLEAAAGLAGLIKAVLALEHEAIPANLHFESLNEHITLDDTRFVIPAETRPWPRGATPRFAGVSGFGFGGTNAHIVLEEAPKLPRPARATISPPFVLPISARDANALTTLAGAYRDLLATVPLDGDAQTWCRDLCHTVAVRREHYEERIAVTGATPEDLRAALDDVVNGVARLGAHRGRVTEDPGIVFVCSGQGSQWPRMGMTLMAQHPVFRDTIVECDAIVQRLAGWSLLAALEASADESRLEHTEIAQPALVALEIALARLWMSWGITPVAVIGHSVGEIAAAHLAGALTLDEAMRVVLHRGRLMERATGTGKMAAVYLAPARVSEAIARFGDRLSIAAVNGPDSVVISGESTAVDEMVAEWQRQSVMCRPLPVDYAFHSAQMEPFQSALTAELGQVTTHPATIPMISTVTGRVIRGADASALDATYWGDNIRRPVRFADAVQEALTLGFRTFVEIGAHPVLTTSIQECCAKTPETVALPSLRRQQDERSTLLASLAGLYVRGAAIDWTTVYPGPAPLVTLPAYPYQRQRYWISRPTTSGAASSSTSATSTTVSRPVHITERPFIDTRVRSPLLSGIGFEVTLSRARFPFLADHVIDGLAILPMAAFVEIVLEAIAEGTGMPNVVLEDVVVQQPLIIPDIGTCTVHVLLEGTRFRVFSEHRDAWVLHATGAFHAMPASAPPSSAAVPVVSNGTPIAASEHYERASTRGATFGASFQTVSTLSVDAPRVAATVRMTTMEDAESLPFYMIHPTLLDGCFQTVLAVASEGSGPVWVPIAIDRVEVWQAAGPEVRSVLDLRTVGESGDTLAADVWVTDPAGRPIMTVTGLRFTRSRPQATDPASRALYRIRWQARPRGAVAPSPHQNTHARAGRWLIVGNNDAATNLRDVLERRGEACTVIPADASMDTHDMSAYRGIVHVAAMDTIETLDAGDRGPSSPNVDTVVERGCRSALALVQTTVHAIARQSGATTSASAIPRLWFVTQGAQAIVNSDSTTGFAQASVLGFARTVAAEHPELACTTVDLDPAGAIAPLVDELLLSDGEDRVVFRGRDRYVARLEPFAASLPSITPRRLTIPVRGTLDGLTFEPMTRRLPDPGEIEVAVDASSLNFRDVLNALGMYPGDPGPLGLEFAGRVTRVGDGVTRWHVGDRVMGISWGSFASYVVTSASLVTEIPDALDMEAAATIPNAFLTAHHCLINTAKLQRGERVLIHAGAGGVGMAAIQLARYVGAEIFATAGSESKRELLRSLGVQHVFDSRTLDFARDVLAHTNGRGVDVVLNSLSGEFIDASFAALAPHGRFVEIGKIGIWTDEQVATLGKDITYTIVDLGPAIDNEPAMIGEQLDRISALMADGTLTPLPARVFPFEEAHEALRFMAQARHVGRIVLRFPERVTIHAHGTYLITGGLGGIGLQIARWLVVQGATHIILLGRSTPSRAVQATIDELAAQGATIDVQQTDVTQRTDVEALLRDVRATGRPLRGVIHAAGVIDDGVLEQQTWERFATVLAPKVRGAWNLHAATMAEPLDFFILCSSVAAEFGSPGQSAYAAGNAFLDALAAHRRAEGLPALSIDWGVWAEVGMAARVESQGRKRVLGAIRPMMPDDCVACMARAIPLPESHVVIVDADWHAWTGYVPSLLTNLVRPAHPTSSVTADVGGGIAERLAQAPEASRRGVLIEFIRQEARRVVGLSDSHPIDERQPLLKMGLDSLMAVELRNRLAAALGRPLPATLLFDHPTPAALADFLIGPSVRAASADATPSAEELLLDDITAMSDEDAERLLEREFGTS